MDKNSFEKLVKYVMVQDMKNESICLTTNPQESLKELNSTLNRQIVSLYLMVFQIFQLKISLT